jgi:hypothetical protein
MNTVNPGWYPRLKLGFMIRRLPEQMTNDKLVFSRISPPGSFFIPPG